MLVDTLPNGVCGGHVSMLKTCINEECKKLFNGFSEVHLCPVCQKKEKEYFMTVRTYLKENPGSSVAKIHEETAVPLEIIMKLMEEGEFKAPKNQASCTRCGTALEDPNSRINICSRCAQALQQQIGPIKPDKTADPVLKSANPVRTHSTRDSDKKYGLGSSR